MLVIAALLSTAAHAVEIPHELFKLDNGLTVILHPDHALPQVVVSVWVQVGSKDEVEGRSGFAHLFEHLMFMGTTRLPGAGFDQRMEASGGWNNAWTSTDATNYYDVGPSNLVETFLWMEADRMDGLAGAMTQEKLDLQRDVVRNERRQSVEDEPYGEVWTTLPEALFPAGHPYAHSVIGSHEDLEAATVEDVLQFFHSFYLPNNASLVIAGDFDPEAIKPVLARTFGAVATGPAPAHAVAEPVDLPVVPLTELTDQVQVPLTVMAWNTPAALTDVDAHLDLVAAILGDGRSSRLYHRLIHSEGSALEVDASQASRMLGSMFMIDAKPAPGHDVAELEAAVAEDLERLAILGPTPAELERVKNQIELSFVLQLEPLRARASALNRYYALTGDPGFLSADLDRYRRATAADVQAAAALLTPERRAIIRVRPAAEAQ